MEIFIFKFPYIANYEIISVGLAVISFCLLDIVTSTYSIDKQSAPWTGSRGWGEERQLPTNTIYSSTLVPNTSVCP